VEVNVDVQVNRNVSTTQDGSFLSGQAYFISSIETKPFLHVKEKFLDALSVDLDGNPFDGLRVNLSRNGTKSACNMRIDSLAAHDHHAPTFSSESDMENYITRVMDRVTEVVAYMDTMSKVVPWVHPDELEEVE